MIDASTHTRKIWRSHFDGADSTYITFFVLVSRTVEQTVVLAKTDHVVFICIVVDIIFQNNAWWHLTFIEDNIIYMQALSKMLDR
jgi:polyhydroxyalkanoate synthesis regulator protein